MVSNRHDVSCSLRPTRARGPEGHKLSAWSTGEVVEIHADEDAAVVAADRGTHGVDAISVWSCVGGCLNGLSGSLDQLLFA
ncbi:hypothetical protein [Aeromicrobium sp.]|uniref:hypothetical protein n=1 Tax=Aeromicrobium sp. TaxID=1871063 RepID=UPI0030C08D80